MSHYHITRGEPKVAGAQDLKPGYDPATAVKLAVVDLCGCALPLTASSRRIRHQESGREPYLKRLRAGRRASRPARAAPLVVAIERK
jgi:hypothetical protein